MKFTREFVVDLWKTGAHSVEVGIKKEEVLRAKSRQFTKDMDIFGNVKDKKNDLGYVAYREEPWKEDVPNKRIIIKNFTKSMNWKGSVEELVARGVSQSLAAGKPLPAFMINLTSNSRLIKLEKVQKHGSFGKSVFSFVLVDDNSNEFSSFIIQADRLTIGSDWDVLDRRGEKIAEIDGAGFNIGGKYTIRIDEKASTFRKELDDVLILFAALSKFLEDVEKKLEKTMKYLEKEENKLIIAKEESMLYANPRLIKM